MRSKLIGLVVGVVVLLIGIGFTVKLRDKPIIIEEEIIEELPKKPSKTIESYYPIAKDSIWQYGMKNNTSDKLIVSVDFIKDNVLQLRYKKGNEITVKVFIAEEEALYEVATIEDAFTKTDYTLLRQYKEVALKLPLEVGNSWVLKDGATRTITAVDKVQDTPMGELKTIEVSTKHKDYDLIQAYAEKIGVVSTYFDDKEGKGTLVIEEYVTNQPVKTYIDVYYPNVVEKEIDLKREQVSIMTNEEPRHFLTDVLSLQPSEDYIQPLPLDAEINEIYVQEEEKTVHIDLSNNYKYSDYTKAEEKLALQSIARTVGHYYRMDYVTITVNGEVYKERIRVGW